MLYGVQYCNHANEVPNVCPCNEYCYCRYEGSCQPRRDWMFCSHPQIPAYPCPCDDQCICRLAGNCADQSWRRSDECPECFEKPGSPALCAACYRRRELFSERQATYKKAKAPPVDPSLQGTYGRAQTPIAKVQTPAGKRLAEIWCLMNDYETPSELEAFSDLFPEEEWATVSKAIWDCLYNELPDIRKAGSRLWNERKANGLDPATGQPGKKTRTSVPDAGQPVRIYDFEEE